MQQACHNLRVLVGQKLGLDLSRSDDQHLLSDLEDAARDLELEVGLYLEKLREEPSTSQLWVPLIDRLTIAETYFFRDQGQMSLLRQTIIPELLGQLKGRRLRVWSAGCSSGEEIYSLAMILDRLHALPADLFGTDVNPVILGQAREGVFRNKALRNLPEGYLNLYFQPKGANLVQLNRRLRDNVSFHIHNLADSLSTYLHGLDLVICRNVMIYFQRDLLSRVLDGFYRSLRPGGILITGHGETLTVESAFQTEVYTHSVVYRKPALPTAERPNLTPPATNSSPPTSAPAPGILTASDYLKQAQEKREWGAEVEARDLLSKALYLDPDLGQAYLELALLHLENDPVKARKYRSTALGLLFKAGGRMIDSEIERQLAELERRLP